ncbi:hypothetical protein [Halocynthiibacter namhaensis]|uniref:hypothetical protein n=1 Tax=Halocynthiibacter namhaensis TaxID=1290553 RepID=UPI00057937CF|nr:hypothetical protein [Halocynthiibacter namhaensis]
MKNGFKILTAVAFTAIATAASAECNAEYIQAQTLEISAGMQALAVTNPGKMMELSTYLEEAMNAATETNDCTLLDGIVADLNG